MNFKILWIDDEPTWVESIRKDVEEHIVKLGFTPEIICHEDGGQIDDYILRADMDMIIIDCNLDEDESKSGEHLIEHIRRKGNFLDIVFYSQDPEVVSEKLNVYKEHVHCVPREDVGEKVNDLIDFSKHKYADSGYMRGSIIAEAIDIENLLEEIMINSFGNYGGLFRTRVLEKSVYDFMKKYMYVQSLLKASCSALEKNSDKTADERRKLATLKESKDIMAKFAKDVVEMRNTLAHAPKRWSNDGQLQLIGLTKEKTKIDVSREWMMEMRSELAKYRGVLNQISEENLLLESEEAVGPA